MSKVKVEQALARRMKLKDPLFRLKRWGDLINGHVISTSFNGMDDVQRQRSIWGALEGEFGADARRIVGMILAYTPIEWDFDAVSGRKGRRLPVRALKTPRRPAIAKKSHAAARS